MPRPKIRGGAVVLYEELRTFEILLEKIPDECTAQQILSQIISAKRALTSDGLQNAKRIVDVIRDSLIDVFDMLPSY